MNGNRNSGQMISGFRVPEGGDRPGWTGLLVAVAVVLAVGGFAFSRGYGPRSVSPTTGWPVSVSPSTSSTTTSPATVVETLEPVDPIEFDWMHEVVDLTVWPNGNLVAVAPVGGVAMLDGSGEWMSISVEALPEGTPDDGWPGRFITQVAAAPGGSLWVAGHAMSGVDDEQFGGIIDGWTGGRTLLWIARYHCPICGEWTVFTTNEVPELVGDIGDLVVSSDGMVYASVGEDSLMVFDGYAWESYTVPLPSGSNGVAVPWSNALAVGTDGVVWATTNYSGWGVVAFDGAGFTRYRTGDVLPGSMVFQVAVAADGTIWVANDWSGVAGFDGTTWTPYTTDDGLLSNEAVIATGTDGPVWAVHPGIGYSRFDETGWTNYPFDPPVGEIRAAVTADGMLWTISDEDVISFDGVTRTIHSSPFAQPVGSFTLTPVQWEISLDDPEWDPGIHTVRMIADARPLTVDHVEDVSGRLIWDKTVVGLCGISIRHRGFGFVHIGDIFQTSEGCGSNPTAMQDAFDEFGLPETACLTTTFVGVDHEYCAPLRQAR